MPTIDPILSVLIPSVPSRLHLLGPLYARLEAQVKECGQPVEILVCMDNKARSIGLKRQALLDIARGRFVAFCDDDDEVTSSYIESLTWAIRVHPETDVVTFHQTSILDGKAVEIHFGLHYRNEEVQIPGPGVFKRQPWHVCAWRRDIAQRCVFPDASYGEDWYWAAQCNKLARHEVNIEKVLHVYRWSPSVTEAEHTFPPKEIPEPLPEPRRPR
jgi:glycosyltransferase involved in cell wall biosynthesis